MHLSYKIILEKKKMAISFEKPRQAESTPRSKAQNGNTGTAPLGLQLLTKSAQALRRF